MEENNSVKPESTNVSSATHETDTFKSNVVAKLCDKSSDHSGDIPIEKKATNVDSSNELKLENAQTTPPCTSNVITKVERSNDDKVVIPDAVPISFSSNNKQSENNAAEDVDKIQISDVHSINLDNEEFSKLENNEKTITEVDELVGSNANVNKIKVVISANKTSTVNDKAILLVDSSKEGNETVVNTAIINEIKKQSKDSINIAVNSDTLADKTSTVNDKAILLVDSSKEDNETVVNAVNINENKEQSKDSINIAVSSDTLADKTSTVNDKAILSVDSSKEGNETVVNAVSIKEQSKDAICVTVNSDTSNSLMITTLKEVDDGIVNFKSTDQNNFDEDSETSNKVGESNDNKPCEDATNSSNLLGLSPKEGEYMVSKDTVSQKLNKELKNEVTKEETNQQFSINTESAKPLPTNYVNIQVSDLTKTPAELTTSATQSPPAATTLKSRDTPDIKLATDVNITLSTLVENVNNIANDNTDVLTSNTDKKSNLSKLAELKEICKSIQPDIQQIERKMDEQKKIKKTQVEEKNVATSKIAIEDQHNKKQDQREELNSSVENSDDDNEIAPLQINLISESKLEADLSKDSNKKNEKEKQNIVCTSPVDTSKTVKNSIVKTTPVTTNINSVMNTLDSAANTMLENIGTNYGGGDQHHPTITTSPSEINPTSSSNPFANVDMASIIRQEMMKMLPDMLKQIQKPPEETELPPKIKDKSFVLHQEKPYEKPNQGVREYQPDNLSVTKHLRSLDETVHNVMYHVKQTNKKNTNVNLTKPKPINVNPKFLIPVTHSSPARILPAPDNKQPHVPGQSAADSNPVYIISKDQFDALSANGSQRVVAGIVQPGINAGPAGRNKVLIPISIGSGAIQQPQSSPHKEMPGLKITSPLTHTFIGQPNVTTLQPNISTSKYALKAGIQPQQTIVPERIVRLHNVPQPIQAQYLAPRLIQPELNFKAPQTNPYKQSTARVFSTGLPKMNPTQEKSCDNNKNLGSNILQSAAFKDGNNVKFCNHDKLELAFDEIVEKQTFGNQPYYKVYWKVCTWEKETDLFNSQYSRDLIKFIHKKTDIKSNNWNTTIIRNPTEKLATPANIVNIQNKNKELIKTASKIQKVSKLKKVANSSTQKSKATNSAIKKSQHKVDSDVDLSQPSIADHDYVEASQNIEAAKSLVSLQEIKSPKPVVLLKQTSADQVDFNVNERSLEQQMNRTNFPTSSDSNLLKVAKNLTSRNNKKPIEIDLTSDSFIDKASGDDESHDKTASAISPRDIIQRIDYLEKETPLSSPDKCKPKEVVQEKLLEKEDIAVDLTKYVKVKPIILSMETDVKTSGGVMKEFNLASSVLTKKKKEVKARDMQECKHCNIKVTDLAKHNRTFSKYSCQICQLRVCNKKKLIKHIADHSNPIFQCDKCFQVFQDDGTYEKHHNECKSKPAVTIIKKEKQKQIKKKFRCKSCKKLYNSMYIYKKHKTKCCSVAISDETKKHKRCLICKKLFHSFSKLEQHVALHKVTFEECLACGECFDIEDKVTTHQCTETPNIKFSDNSKNIRIKIDENQVLTNEKRTKIPKRTNLKIKKINRKYCLVCIKGFKNNLQHFDVHSKHCPIIKNSKTCTICNKVFVKTEELQEHIGKCFKEGLNSLVKPQSKADRKSLKSKNKSVYHCSRCSLLFQSLSLLKVHRKLKHVPSKIYQTKHQCIKCRFDCYSQSLLHKHIKEKSCRKVTSYSCFICDEGRLIYPHFGTLSQLISHLNSHPEKVEEKSPPSPTLQPVCITSESGKTKLLNIEPKDLALLENKLAICHVAGFGKYELQLHGDWPNKHLTARKLNENNAKSMIAGESSSTGFTTPLLVEKNKTEILPNVNVVNKINCYKCRDTFTSKKDLVIHFRLVHKYRFIKLTICPVCDTGFKSHVSCFLHNKTCSKELNPSQIIVKKNDKLKNQLFYHPKDKSCTCGDCRAKTISSVKQLLKLKELCYCRKCDKQFPCRHHLNIHHGLVHPTTNVFACDICDQPFLNYTSLHAHYKEYHTLKDFEITSDMLTLVSMDSCCVFCRSYYKDIRWHIRSHFNFMYECYCCNTKVSNQQLLINHMFSVHKRKWTLADQKLSLKLQKENAHNILQSMYSRSKITKYIPQEGERRCSTCNNVFFHPLTLKRHIASRCCLYINAAKLPSLSDDTNEQEEYESDYSEIDEEENNDQVFSCDYIANEASVIASEHVELDEPNDQLVIDLTDDNKPTGDVPQKSAGKLNKKSHQRAGKVRVKVKPIKEIKKKKEKIEVKVVNKPSTLPEKSVKVVASNNKVIKPSKVKELPNKAMQHESEAIAANKKKPQEKIISCGRCDNNFTNERSLFTHIEETHLKVECPSCGALFSSTYRCFDHFSIAHSYQRKPTLSMIKESVPDGSKLTKDCPNCHLTFYNDVCYYKHLFTHFDIATETCYICSMSFPTMDCLKEHVRSSHKAFFCKCCYKVFHTYYDLNYHSQLHVIECNIPRDEKGKMVIQIDSNALESNALVKLSPSNKSSPSFFITKSVPKSVIEDQRLFYCYVCHKNIEGELTFIVHMKTHSEPRPLWCIMCKRTFSDMEDLEKHFKHHLNERVELQYESNDEVADTNIEEVLKCDICSEVFDEKDSFAEHQKSYEKRTVNLNEEHLEYSEIVRRYCIKSAHRDIPDIKLWRSDWRVAIKHDLDKIYNYFFVTRIKELHPESIIVDKNLATYICQFCYIPLNLSEVRKHLRKHLHNFSNCKAANCIECEKTVMRYDFYEHMVSKHRMKPLSGKLTCQFCYTNLDSFNVEGHMLKHQQDLPIFSPYIYCSFCNKLATKDQLVTHMKEFSEHIEIDSSLMKSVTESGTNLEQKEESKKKLVKSDLKKTPTTPQTPTRKSVVESNDVPETSTLKSKTKKEKPSSTPISKASKKNEATTPAALPSQKDESPQKNIQKIPSKKRKTSKSAISSTKKSIDTTAKTEQVPKKKTSVTNAKSKLGKKVDETAKVINPDIIPTIEATAEDVNSFKEDIAESVALYKLLSDCKNMKCTICHKAFNLLIHLKEHLIRHLDHPGVTLDGTSRYAKCVYCKTLMKTGSIRCHVLIKHNKEYQLLSEPKDEEKNIATPTQKAVARSLITPVIPPVQASPTNTKALGKGYQIVPIVGPLADTAYPFTCIICYRGYFASSQYIQHVKTRHPHIHDAEKERLQTQKTASKIVGKKRKLEESNVRKSGRESHPPAHKIDAVNEMKAKTAKKNANTKPAKPQPIISSGHKILSPGPKILSPGRKIVRPGHPPLSFKNDASKDGSSESENVSSPNAKMRKLENQGTVNVTEPVTPIKRDRSKFQEMINKLKKKARTVKSQSQAKKNLAKICSKDKLIKGKVKKRVPGRTTGLPNKSTLDATKEETDSPAGDTPEDKTDESLNQKTDHNSDGNVTVTNKAESDETHQSDGSITDEKDEIEEITTEEEIIESSEEDMEFVCTQCNVSFKTKQELDTHDKQAHPKHKGKSFKLPFPYICLFCGKGFNETLKLKMHLLKVHESLYTRDLEKSVQFQNKSVIQEKVSKETNEQEIELPKRDRSKFNAVISNLKSNRERTSSITKGDQESQVASRKDEESPGTSQKVDSTHNEAVRVSGRKRSINPFVRELLDEKKKKAIKFKTVTSPQKKKMKQKSPKVISKKIKKTVAKLIKDAKERKEESSEDSSDNEKSDSDTKSSLSDEEKSGNSDDEKSGNSDSDRSDKESDTDEGMDEESSVEDQSGDEYSDESSSEENKTFVCKYCDIVCKKNHKLRKHEKLHFKNLMRNSNELRCTCCDEMVVRHKLKWHMHTKHGNFSVVNLSRKKIYCPKCTYATKLAKHMDEHILKTHPELLKIECRLCDERFLTQSIYKKHFENTHETSIDEESKMCFLCNKTFNSLPDLYKHYSILHLKKNENFHCPLCSKYFYGQTDYDKHQNEYHNNDKFQCGLCLVEFKDAELCEVHVLVHKSKSDFQCSICNFYFESDEILKRHSKTHDLKCSNCNESFTSRDLLDKHSNENKCEKSSSQEESDSSKSYKCSACDQSFTELSEIQEHMTVIHQGGDATSSEKSNSEDNVNHNECKICNQTFTRLEIFQAHMKQKHS